MLQLRDRDIELLKAGHEPAFEKVYKGFFNALYFFAIQYIDKEAEAENLVQETFMALWLNKEGLSCATSASVKSWLYTTLKNKCINHLEKENTKILYNHYQLNINKAHIDILQTDISEVTFIEVEQLLFKALEQMPEQCRKVFELSRFKGMKNKTIADELGITVKAVEANITRALKTLRIHLKDYLPFCFLMGIF